MMHLIIVEVLRCLIFNSFILDGDDSEDEDGNNFFLIVLDHC